MSERIKLVGAAKLRQMNKAYLRKLKGPEFITAKGEITHVLMPYEYFMKLQELYLKLGSKASAPARESHRGADG